jgi:hypothetical protein
VKKEDNAAIQSAQPKADAKTGGEIKGKDKEGPCGLPSKCTIL